MEATTIDMQTEITSIRDYVDNLRRQDEPKLQNEPKLTDSSSTFVTRSIDLEGRNIKIPEIDAVWDIVKSGITIADKIGTACCGCNLGERVAANLTKLENLKENFTALLVDLNAALGKDEYLESSVSLQDIHRNIENGINEIRSIPFPECLDRIVEICDNVLGSISFLPKETQDQIKSVTDKFLPLVKVIAKTIHSIYAASEVLT